MPAREVFRFGCASAHFAVHGLVFLCGRPGPLTDRRDLRGTWRRPLRCAGRPVLSPPTRRIKAGDMVVWGIDAHKRCHAVVAVDAAGRKLAERALVPLQPITYEC
jgi:hypothetical protein